tara:strand:+ start:1218 stop:1460 length:243 start_codon:yes stop_codon:yes gene_type:complete
MNPIVFSLFFGKDDTVFFFNQFTIQLIWRQNPRFPNAYNVLYETNAIKPTRSINRVIYGFYFHTKTVFNHVIDQIVSGFL